MQKQQLGYHSWRSSCHLTTPLALILKPILAVQKLTKRKPELHGIQNHAQAFGKLL